MTSKETEPRPDEAAARQAYHHGSLSGALVEQVRKLIERDGVADFSIAEACKAIGVSTAAPYKHFADKHDILRHVAQTGFGDLTGAMEQARDGEPKDAVRRIAGMGKAYVTFATGNPETFKLMFGSTPDLKKDDSTRETGHRCFDVLIEEVATFIGADSSAPQSRFQSVLLWTFVHGVASLLIDKDYDAARIPIDPSVLIEEATGRLLQEQR
ncbi:MAG: WHG domain-containing protein [Pseudomonadota bacterium]